MRVQDGFDLADHLAGVAEAVRAVDPTVTLEDLRARLRDHTRTLVRACLPATTDTIGRYVEVSDHHANPQDRRWLRCSRCKRGRSHIVRAGIAYCPCGATNE